MSDDLSAQSQLGLLFGSDVSDASSPVTMPFEYVPLAEVIAEISLRQRASASLTTTSTALLSTLLIVTFTFNLSLLATILSSYKLRNREPYALFCVLAALNLLDVAAVMFVSVVYLINNGWVMGRATCLLNAWAQQFITLCTIFLLVLMALERALGLIDGSFAAHAVTSAATSTFPRRQRLLTRRHAAALMLIFVVVANCFALPLLFPAFSVRIFRFRYLCGVGRSPLAFHVAAASVYVVAFLVLVACFGATIRHQRHARPRINCNGNAAIDRADYGAFIMESRALQDHLAVGRLVLALACAFLLVEGPFIALCFFYQIRNSVELVTRCGEMEMSQDVETVLSWLRFFFPFLVPILILVNCNDIWTKFINLLCCRRHNVSHGVWALLHPSETKDAVRGNMDNVLTLVATADGLQLRVPTNNNYQQEHQQQNLYAQRQQQQNYNKRQQQQRLAERKQQLRSSSSTTSTTTTTTDGGEMR